AAGHTDLPYSISQDVSASSLPYSLAIVGSAQTKCLPHRIIYSSFYGLVWPATSLTRTTCNISLSEVASSHFDLASFTIAEIPFPQSIFHFLQTSRSKSGTTRHRFELAATSAAVRAFVGRTRPRPKASLVSV